MSLSWPDISQHFQVARPLLPGGEIAVSDPPHHVSRPLALAEPLPSLPKRDLMLPRVRKRADRTDPGPKRERCNACSLVQT